VANGGPPGGFHRPPSGKGEVAEPPKRRPQAPAPRRTERVQPPAEAAPREEPESAITEQQIAAMLARLARSAPN